MMATCEKCGKEVGLELQAIGCGNPENSRTEFWCNSCSEKIM